MEQNTCPNCADFKAMSAYCARIYYQNIPPERMQVIREKQRVTKKERYHNDPEFREKTKAYVREYKARKRAEAAQT